MPFTSSTDRDNERQMDGQRNRIDRKGEMIFNSKILNKKIERYDSSYRWTDKLGHL